MLSFDSVWRNIRCVKKKLYEYIYLYLWRNDTSGVRGIRKLYRI